MLRDVWERGCVPGEGVGWNELDVTHIAFFPPLPPHLQTSENGLLCLPLNELGQVIMEHLERYLSAKVLWSPEVIGIEQNEKEATVIVKTPDGEKRMICRRTMLLDGMERIARSGALCLAIGTFLASPGASRLWRRIYVP